MPKPTAIVVWFDDNTRYHIDPSFLKSMFINEAAAAQCGHHGPHQVPGGTGPIRGPFADTAGPPSTGGSSSGSVSTMEGTCYYVNGIVVCP